MTRRVLKAVATAAVVAGMLGGPLAQSAIGQVSLISLHHLFPAARHAAGERVGLMGEQLDPPGLVPRADRNRWRDRGGQRGSNAGNLYSFGTGATTDRALGAISSGNAAIGNMFWGVRLRNNTGFTINSLDVSYVGEQWRNSGAGAQTVGFSYLVGSPAVVGTLAEFQSTGVPVPALDFTSPVTGGTAGALDGNLAANRSLRSTSIFGLNIPAGSEVMLRWADPDHDGTTQDHGLAVDELNVMASSVPGLTVGDVAVDEGDSGTSSLTFTVSLSTPAPQGGVTFDIATADGTARDGNPVAEDDDYVANALTGQTIPAGSSTYTFTVLANGDTAFEPDETMFANVTNVAGAAVSDGQGAGTIRNDDPDTTPPNTTIDTGPVTRAMPDAGVRASAARKPAGSRASSRKLDAGVHGLHSSPQGFTSLSDGSHTFQVRTIDNADNVDPTPATFTWTVDTTAPSATIEQADDQADPTGVSPIEFDVEFSEPVTGFGDADVDLGGTDGRSSLAPKLRLTRFGRSLLARRLGGVRTRVRASGAMSDGSRTATARTRAILRVERFTTPAGAWVPDESSLTARGKRYVRGLRGKLRAVAGLRCDGHDANVNPAASSRLSLACAKVMCGALKQLGVGARPRLDGHGDSQPIASNTTDSGRAKNRRVQVTIIHAG